MSSELSFGADYIIPKATDSRLLEVVSAAVAKAAVDTGVAVHLISTPPW